MILIVKSLERVSFSVEIFETQSKLVPEQIRHDEINLIDPMGIC